MEDKVTRQDLEKFRAELRKDREDLKEVLRFLAKGLDEVAEKCERKHNNKTKETYANG